MKRLVAMMFWNHLKLICGIAGDSLTFVGGAVLAWDALRSPDAYTERQELAETVRRLAGLAVETERGDLLATESDVHLAELHAAKWRAKIGFVLLAIGFLFLLFTRVMEV